MAISFRSLKKSVVNITNTSTNKAFQISVDPSRLQSPFNCRYELFTPCHVLFSPKSRIHTQIEPLDLEFPDSVIKSESPSSRGSESSTSNRGHWKSKAKRRKPADEEDLAVPWTCEDVDLFTPRIRNFKSSRKTRMPNNVKTYDGTGDPEDHLKIFQAATQFDELPPESIDGYKGLKAAFLAYYMQQNKCVKDQVEIHNIKQRDEETIEEFIESFKIETGRMKGAPECMRISEFMHGVNNPELTKRLNEHVPKTVEEMMTATTAFIHGETVVASKKKVHIPWKSQDQSKRHTSERRSDFQNPPKDGRGSNKFTPLTRTPKEIFAAESGKFKPPPLMVTPVEKRSSNKFCEFYNDKGHSTDECVQLRKQIEELVRVGKLSHFIKEIRLDKDQQKTGKKDAPVKDKAAAIYMIQSWQRVTRYKVTQSFAHVQEITFPPLTANKGTKGLLVIEAEIDGHVVHRMYVDGGSSMELRILVTIGDANHSTKAWMDFMIVRSLSPYNGIIGRPEIREIQAVPSTAHGMLKFSANGGIVIIRIVRHDGSTAIDWRASTQYPRRISPYSTEKKGQAPEHAKAIQVEVQKLVEAVILREVYYHDLLSNPVMVKKHDGSFDVRGFHRFKQGLSAGLLPPSRNQLEGRIPLRIPLQVFPGCLQRLSSNTDGRTR
ncbi:reverse transcriptase domain-containing protein [Tanacetum coccineum]